MGIIALWILRPIPNICIRFIALTPCSGFNRSDSVYSAPLPSVKHYVILVWVILVWVILVWDVWDNVSAEQPTGLALRLLHSLKITPNFYDE